MNPISRFGVSVFAGLVLASSAFAYPASPSYAPTTKTISGNQPLVAGSAVLAGSDPYVLTITAPSNSVMNSSYYPSGGLKIDLGVRIPTNVGGNPGVPPGVDATTALSYCTVSPSTVTFSGPGAKVQVTVSVNVPTPVVSGNYYWNVYGTNWPSANVTDLGGTINANVLPPITNPTVKPTIVSLLPANGSSFIYYALTPVQVPISFTATSVSKVAGGATIESLSAKFDTTPLILATTGLSTTNPDGTFSASGSVTPAITDAGQHTITVSATNAAGTTTATTQINIILAPLAPNITNTNNPTFTYGQPGTFAVTWTGYKPPKFAVTAGTLPAGVTLNQTTGALSGTPTTGTGSFPFTITATNSVGAATHTFTLTVNPAPLTVAALAASKAYGVADPASFGYSFSPALFGTDKFTGALARVAGETVGTYAINQGNLTAGNNYTISYTSALFTINAGSQTITFGPLAPVTVGSAPFALTATGGASGNPVAYTSSNLTVATISGSMVTILSAGTTTITASQAGNTNYSAANPVTQSLTVTAAPTTSTVTILWLEPISLEKVQKGGSVLPIRFLLQECSGHNGIGNDDGGRDDDGSWGHSHGWDDNNGWGDDHGRGNDYSGRNVSCHHGRDGRSTDKRNCRYDSDHDDEDQNGCVNLRDKTVVISIYEIGSNKPATQYKYGTGSPNPPDYVIDGDYQYQLNFPTAKGKHVYHIDVYRFPPGATAPVLVGSKEVTTK